MRQKSLNKFKDSIKGKTRRTRGDSLACAVADLNPLLRGWFSYFKHAHHTTFGKLDRFVRRRLRAILLKQEKRPGQGVCRADHQRWPNAFFAKPGCSRFTRPGYRRDSLDEETTDWRAVCEKTACTVRREGSAKADPYPYQ